MLCFDSNLRTSEAAVSLRRKPNEQAPKARKPEQGEAAPQAARDAALIAEELVRIEADDAARADAERAGGVAAVEPADQQAARLERELSEWKDRALRAAADFDNYRKRAIRERDEAAGRAQGDVLARIVDVVDDLARVAHLEPAQTTSEALHEGMLAIERKFLKTLEAAGVERIDPAGRPFDPNLHEAVAALPAPSPDKDHTVGAVYQHGYTFRGMLLRPARVAVLTWTAPAAGDAAAADLADAAQQGDVGGEGGD